MLMLVAALAVQAIAGLPVAPEAPATSDEFSVKAADGYVLRGEADRPAGRSVGAVVLVAGTGAFDRDMKFGRSGTPTDRVFADLGERFAQRGLTAVRYDRRGVRHGAPPAEALDMEAYKSISPESLSADVGAVDAWVRSSEGLNAQCVVYFVHSEGAVHLAGRAEAGMTAPNLIIGMGAPMESKVSAIRWQMTGRDAESLRMMDTDQDGRITNAEVRANWMKTPSAVFGRLEPYLHPEGAWTAEDLEKLETNQTALYTAEIARVEALPADGPYPNAQAPVFSTGWWKSWFTDDKPIAARFAEWPTPMILHYGEIDSQVREARQRTAVEGILAPGQATFVSHAERGHSLGEESLMGPMDERLADLIADEAAKGCA